jgi:hypothetical protein
MGLAHSPRIAMNDLIFALDLGNDKSYKGPVIQNITTQLTQIGTGTANGYSFTASTGDVFIPSMGSMTVKVNSGYNNYSAVSTNCCPSLFFYGSSIAVSASTQYTYGILYKTTSGYTHPNFMYRYEYTSGAVYVTEAGVHSDSNRIHLGDGWYWAWGTFTTQATTANLTLYSFYYKYGTTIDNFYVAKILVARGDYTKLHPKYWPDFNTTRSNTQSVLDMTSRNTLTSGNIAYSNNGTVVFNGANSRIDTGSSVPYSSNTSWEAWINRNTSINTYNMFMGKYLPYFGAMSDGSVIFSNYLTANQRSVLTSTGIIQNNTWYNLAFTTSYNGTNTEMKIYVNGNQRAVGSFVGIQVDVGGNFAIGDGYNAYWYPYSGQVSNVKVYNRTLAETEIQQNFNALRGRFGI